LEIGWKADNPTEEAATTRRSRCCRDKQEEEGYPSSTSRTERYSLAPSHFSVHTTNLGIDLEELSLGTTMKTHFPNPDDILNFKLTIDPDEGMYKGGRFDFDFKINQNFPHDPPKVKCTQKIYHPNIDLEGNVCLNILREDWKPVLNLNAVVVGLQVRYK
jgi:ubiquitin-conjugating enzyme E2 M